MPDFAVVILADNPKAGEALRQHLGMISTKVVRTYLEFLESEARVRVVASDTLNQATMDAVGGGIMNGSISLEILVVIDDGLASISAASWLGYGVPVIAPDDLCATVRRRLDNDDFGTLVYAEQG